MLLKMYYHVLLVWFLSSSTSLHVCEASRNARVGLQGLEERAGSRSTSLDEQNVPELKRRQQQTVTPAAITVTLVSATDVTTVFDVVTIPPTSSESLVVVIQTRTSTPSTLSTSTTSTQSSTITSASSFLCDTGYSLCGAEYNGGCCRSGYTCAIDSCIPPATVTVEQRTCSTGSFLCPASVNYGCCPGGYSCGISQCSPTSQMTFTSKTGIITTDSAGSTITSTVSMIIAGGALVKATESNLGAKQTTGTAITSSTPTASHTGTQLPLSGIAIGGIAAGGVIGILMFVLVGWCTYRRVGSRGNNDPPGGVSTTNAYHPSMTPILRNPGSGSSTRYHAVTPEHTYPLKQPTSHLHNHSTNYSNNYSNNYPNNYPNNHPNNHPTTHYPVPMGLAEMEESHPSSPQNDRTSQWGTDQWGGRLGADVQQDIGELPGDGRPGIQEVEGTIPGKRGKRRSRQLLKRISGSSQG